jgi:hypothetical protein
MLDGESKYTPQEFEDDVFNLMKYLFWNGEKWGKERSGSTVPEAVIGYSTYYRKIKRGFKWGRISIIWDCKYHHGSGTYHFTRAEIDKARRYIKQANHCQAIKKFSGQLNCYAVFCDKLNHNKFNNFVDALYRIRSWRGTVILVSSKALLKLYSFARIHEETFIQKHEVFLMLVSRLIERPSPVTHVTLDEKQANQLIRAFDCTNLPANLDYKHLRQTFELDEIF